ncbi:MAG: penicillin-binding protein 1B [Pseudomonadota bacterium]
MRLPRLMKFRLQRKHITILLISGLIFSVLIVIYGAYLNRVVRLKFEGKRWSVPAHVYARPLEIFAGARIQPAQLTAELAMLKYQMTGRTPLENSGTFARNGDEFQLYTRTFNYWDGEQKGKRVRLSVQNGIVSELFDTAKDQPLDLLRLEPVMIGGIYPSHKEDRILVKLDEVPKLLIDTLVAVEDRKFYEHYGIVPSAVFRAVLTNMRARGAVQGGSTLTQQLVKNFFLTNERSLWRKFNEAIMALELEWHYEKNEILEAYMNEIYLGQDGNRAIHGFGMGSHFYFEKPLSELRADEVALLVGLVKGPSFYDPRRHPARAKSRRDTALEVMRDQGLLDRKQEQAARARALNVVPQGNMGVTPHPAFIDLVRRQLQRDYQEQDLTSEGLRIFTTMDPVAQGVVEKNNELYTKNLEKGRNLKEGTLESAVLIAGIENGEIQAIVGGRDPKFAGFNRALDAERQVGSLLKPLVYLTALERVPGFNLATLLDDSKFTYNVSSHNVWEPENYDKSYHGQVPMFVALANSYNIAVARLGTSVGIDNIVDVLHKLGMQREITPYPSLVLGAQTMTPFEVTQIYQTLASGGFRAPLRAIREVTTSNGQPLQRYTLTVEQAVSPTSVYLLSRAMQNVPRIGTAKSLYNMVPESLQVAGKTGTTDDMRDSWFAGYTGDKVMVTWLGADDNRAMGFTGASGALQIWGRILAALGGYPLELTAPPDVTDMMIDPVSGLKGEGCPGAVVVPFVSGTAPSGDAPCAQGVLERAVSGTVEWVKEAIQPR